MLESAFFYEKGSVARVAIVTVLAQVEEFEVDQVGEILPRDGEDVVGLEAQEA